MYDSNEARTMRVAHSGTRRRRDTFTVCGDLDSAAADVLFNVLLPAVLSVESDTVLLNMAGVTAFDLSGVDALVDLADVARACGKDILLVAPSDGVVRLIRSAGRGRALRHLVGAGSRTAYLKL